jgi:diketogulonate reductase-like aldo/keto reductase
MQTHGFGWTGVEVPIIGQGTWQLERADRKIAIATLWRGLDAGMRHIDTAEMYGAGSVEEIVGEAIAGRRKEVFLTSKVLPQNASSQGTVQACERSLKRLKTDRLDLYLLHWRGEHPLEHTLRAFERLQGDGKIRFFGVSNFDVADLEQAESIVGEKKIACNQILYHLQERAIELRVLPWCKSRQIAVVGYSPFGSGRFPAASSAGGRVLAEIAKKRSATPRQVALRFLVRDPDLFTIPMTSNPDHAAENARAADLALSAEEIKQIDAAFPRGDRRTLPML